MPKLDMDIDSQSHTAGPSLGRAHRIVGTLHHTGRTQISSKFLNAKILGFTPFAVGFFAIWVIYLLVALVKNPDRAMPFAVITGICASGTILARTGQITKIRASLPSTPDVVNWVVLGLLTLVMLVIIGMQVIPESDARASRLQALLGTVSFLLVCAIFSKNRAGIPWQMVLSGLLLQFFMGVFVLRTETGMNFFKNTGNVMSDFLNFSDHGASFVFGKEHKMMFFAFKVLPTTVFFSAFISSLYYLGLMQITVRIIAVMLKKIVGSSLIQSVNAAGNLFLGQTEAPLLIRPFLSKASPCDLHCVMVGGFASIAGGVLAAYIGMGISADQLIGASVMSVPGTLVISNLVCPPGSVPELSAAAADDVNEAAEEQDDDHFEFPPSSENNIIEAAGNGAHIAIDLVLNIGAMLIAFISLIAFIDVVLGYLGGLVDVPELSFEMICGILFYPIAWLLGAPHYDCQQVAKLIGTKIFVNEFVAYSDLGEVVKDANGPGISPRAELAATYALCGFSNIGSIGVQMGCLSSLCPERQRAFAQLVVSAMISGNVVCFLTATIAGVLN